MKRINLTALITVLVMLAIAFLQYQYIGKKVVEDNIKVGFIYEGDASTPYSANFIATQEELQKYFGSKITTYVYNNVPEDDCEFAFQGLVSKNCDLIFSTSYGYEGVARKMAEKHSWVEICQATGDNANVEPTLSNYHTYMGNISEGRYITGMVAGMKLKELIDCGKMTPEQAKIGYVGAMENPEVISGYTAFLLGIRQYVPEATMTVIYTNAWNDFALEKKCAEQLIEEGCVVIGQHSDTTGPAMACERAAKEKIVYHVGYNQSMTNIAPSTSLVSCRINWTPYEKQVIQAVLNNDIIEKNVKAVRHGNDCGAGFDEGWIQVLDLNEIIAAADTKEMIEDAVESFSQGSIEVFKGNYTGTNPKDSADKIDLAKGFRENSEMSAPSFRYVLDGIITIEKLKQ